MSPNRGVELRSAGYFSIPDVILLTGIPEPDLRSRMGQLRIYSQVRFGVEAVAESDARRLMERSGQASTSEERTVQPGFSLLRLRTLMRRAITATELNLSGLIILTEAASGAYATTAVIAAMAGAERVYAYARPSRYGSVAEVEAWVLRLASFVGVADRITVLDTIPEDILGSVDIVTNSGHLRPLTAQLIDRLPDHAIIALMFEAWEFRPEDIEIEACLRRNICVVGVNERHPAVDVFSFLGPLCVRQLHDCGLAVYGNRIALLCDNDFAESMLRGLQSAGASVQTFASVAALVREEWDAIVVALRPASGPRIGEAEARHISLAAPAGIPVAQFWGDVDRKSILAYGLSVWPPREPGPGHMGVMLSDIGPEPIVKLQTGGLRAAEWIKRGGAELPDGFAQLVRLAL
jgi:hypothetical protein